MYYISVWVVLVWKGAKTRAGCPGHGSFTGHLASIVYGGPWHGTTLFKWAPKTLFKALIACKGNVNYIYSLAETVFYVPVTLNGLSGTAQLYFWFAITFMYLGMNLIYALYICLLCFVAGTIGRMAVILVGTTTVDCCGWKQEWKFLF